MVAHDMLSDKMYANRLKDSIASHDESYIAQWDAKLCDDY